MKRGDLYKVERPILRDPRKARVFVVLSRQVLIDSEFPSVICAPVYPSHDGLVTQVGIGPAEGLKHHSSIHCDNLVSLPKSSLKQHLGTLSQQKLDELAGALQIALGVDL